MSRALLEPARPGHDALARLIGAARTAGWRFIKTEARGPLPIHLGLGRDDRFRARHRTLAAALEAKNVDVVPGGHEWPVWRTLWERFLDARMAQPG